MIIDLCVQSNSRVFWFTEGKEGEKVKILFDKKNVIAFKPMDYKKFKKELDDRKDYLFGEYHIMKIETEKELERNDYLGALNFYINLTNTFIELVRTKHSPTKTEFGLKHISRDLPKSELVKIEKIFQHRSTADLRENLSLMDNIVSELK